MELVEEPSELTQACDLTLPQSIEEGAGEFFFLVCFFLGGFEIWFSIFLFFLTLFGLWKEERKKGCGGFGRGRKSKSCRPSLRWACFGGFVRDGQVFPSSFKLSKRQ